MRAPSWTPTGAHVAVWAPNARMLEAALLVDGTWIRTALHRSWNGVWEGELDGALPGQAYAFFADGVGPLLDPRAARIVEHDGALRSVFVEHRFDWGSDASPSLPWEQSVIYECHVRGLTMQHPDVPEALRGTYRALAHPAVIDHLRALGVTALQLMPIAHAQTEPFLTESGRTNYWGYNTVGFCAPSPRFAVDDPVVELKEAIRALHRAGIEVILDVVFNHTAEGNQDGPIHHLRGLDERAWYCLDAKGRYADITGCGNTLDCSKVEVAALVRDALRVWTDAYHVDGFRFDLASALFRSAAGAFDHEAPLFELIRDDPVLTRRKLIAEPWDLGGYFVGAFPAGWSEINGKFRDTARSLWRGDRIPLGEVATRLAGSSDLYGDRRPSASIDLITCHDGFTLADLGAYQHKHNEANGEENRDGSDFEHSLNHGIEGATDDPAILDARDAHRRALVCLLAIGRGVPLISHGDELGRTQHGNNNAYCQDNPIAWVDWSPDKRDRVFLEFFREAMRTRRRLPALHDGQWWTEEDTRWMHPDGSPFEEADWQDPELDALVAYRESTPPLLIALNRGREAVELALPDGWIPVLDSALVPSEQASTLQGRSIKVLAPHARSEYGAEPKEKRMRRERIEAFESGRAEDLWKWLGAHVEEDGVRFATWAPNARAVGVVGDFNGWSPEPLERVDGTGIWQAVIPQARVGQLYKLAIEDTQGQLHLKADPFARASECPPGTASRVAASHYRWSDEAWMQGDRAPGPTSIYEVHPGSWRRNPDGSWLGWRALADALVPYVTDLGFTHIQLMPVMEHPFYGSWGYQVSGYFAPTARYGEPDDLRAFVDACHQAGLGVLFDWVPGHFVKDEAALGRFDGTPLYEHWDPRRGEHPDWGTWIFDYGRPEVQSFLISNALYWLEEFHFDGLRVDAVASMLYLDYSRRPGEWAPNVHGGKENLQAITWLQQLNESVHRRFPRALTIAEESTTYPGVTHSVADGGLGFDLKWNMGWMHDTLKYFRTDPLFRGAQQDRLTFAMVYQYSERFLNPLSHDEVVFGKGSLLEKMHGSPPHKLANLRALYTYQRTRPGPSLVFMGAELASHQEWSHERELSWHLLDDPSRHGLRTLLRDLAALERSHPALWEADHDREGFEWIACDDRSASVLSYVRRSEEDLALVVLHLTPVARIGYRIGVPHPGAWRIVIDTDDSAYAGPGARNATVLLTEPTPFHGHDQSIALNLPALGALVLAPAEHPHAALRELASKLAITDSYRDIDGLVHHTLDATRQALVQGMGWPAEDAEQAAASLARLEERAQRPVPPTAVVLEEEDRLTLSRPVSGSWSLTVTLEEGEVHTTRGSSAEPIDSLPLPPLPLGYHHVELTLDGDTTTQHRIVVPPRCPTVEDVLAATPERQAGRTFGLCVNLYSVRSDRNQGVGDLSDVADLAEWVGENGGDFVGLNPLHISANAWPNVSPYGPISRLFRNPLYLDLEAIPGLSETPAARAALDELDDELRTLRTLERVDYDRAMALKDKVLRAVHAATTPPLPTDALLLSFATYMAIRVEHGSSWRAWPTALQDPDSESVQAYRETHSEEVSYHAWLQQQLDDQLGRAADRARASGMRIGLYEDLAVGGAQDGFDTWAFQGVFADGPTLGCPPDPLGPEGQNWALPPMSPQALQETGFAFWRELIRRSLAHAGALRIDHALGLARQFWIPAWRPSSEGAYIQFPTDALMGILALESTRRSALVVGEDLGTVPDGFVDILAKWGILSTGVLFFTREPNGDFTPAAGHSHRALVTATTHDLPPLRAWWDGADLALQQTLGADLDLPSAQRARRVECERLCRQMRRDDALDTPPTSWEEAVVAVHRWLARTPAPLVGVWLDDIAGELEPVNVPGMTQDRFPSWTRRMQQPLEELLSSQEAISRLVAAVRPQK